MSSSPPLRSRTTAATSGRSWVGSCRSSCSPARPFHEAISGTASNTCISRACSRTSGSRPFPTPAASGRVHAFSPSPLLQRSPFTGTMNCQAVPSPKPCRSWKARELPQEKTVRHQYEYPDALSGRRVLRHPREVPHGADKGPPPGNSPCGLCRIGAHAH